MKKITCILFAGICLLACSITVYGQSLGDVDSNGSIDIVDGLLIAQYYVGLNPSNFNSSVADTDCSGGIDIVDALLIAQYYVGLIQQFPCSTTPAPTAAGNLVNVALTATSSTSHVSDWESIDALNNGIDPANSNDTSNLAYGNWPETGTQWVQYDFNQIYNISSMEVYWFDDDEGIDLPSSCRLLYNNGQGLVEVPNPNGYGTAANRYNVTTFSNVSTSQVRLEMVSNGSSSTGILEWKVWGTGGSPTSTPAPGPTPGPTTAPGGTPPEKTVRVFWLRPSDYAYDQQIVDGIANVMREAQRFYFQEMGVTFRLNDPIVEVCDGDHPQRWYETNTSITTDPYWISVFNGADELKRKYGLQDYDPRWVIVEEISAEGNGAGGGGGGHWVLLPQHDVDGAAGYGGNMNRWYGGMVHELGHAFMLPDSSYTDGTPLSASFYDYPNCHFTQQQINGMLNDPLNAGFFTSDY